MQHALIAAFSLQSEAVAVMMCALLSHFTADDPNVTDDGSGRLNLAAVLLEISR